MEGDRIGTGGNSSDISISFSRPPKQHIQVQSSVGDGVKEEELIASKETSLLDYQIKDICLKICAIRLDCFQLQQMVISLTAMCNSEFSYAHRLLKIMSLMAQNQCARMELRKGRLMKRKNDLEYNLRYAERQRESETANFLKKEGELMTDIQELISETDDSTGSLLSKDIEINVLTEALRNVKKEVEAATNEMEALLSLEVTLIVLRDKAVEIVAENKELELTMKKKVNLITSLREEARLEREQRIYISEMERKEKEEITRVNKDLLVEKDNQVFKNNLLKEELKELNEHMSYLKRSKKLLSGLTIAAVVTSVGIAAGSIFNLHRKIRNNEKAGQSYCRH